MLAVQERHAETAASLLARGANAKATNDVSCCSEACSAWELSAPRPPVTTMWRAASVPTHSLPAGRSVGCAHRIGQQRLQDDRPPPAMKRRLVGVLGLGFVNENARSRRKQDCHRGLSFGCVRRGHRTNTACLTHGEYVCHTARPPRVVARFNTQHQNAVFVCEGGVGGGWQTILLSAADGSHTASHG